ncbi:aspartic peptidase domain-containing protein [Cantharellus anzutake]|uniref:aspartic peptidase domain-containing protein n=1 Tax=Cantharellus anzutake TaxID=1750568 RepID=UPI00190483F6|nr:aspartic peptidase domain-containing protein [Cantharellus anzutake]XP_038917103.1 aspartic peptidase domain-containing protein [Cantharellus anzutake]KAF8314874.1 aspartic peptidase domain-containing protein [Cantharellus anzutake]KAF8332809.1 aspartic peptidase domain-containing protein [Cantharellus anzutake]
MLLIFVCVCQDLEYVVPVVVGTPGQIVRLDFDTGSSDLWVWSTHLHASTSNLKSHRVYDPRKSSTARSMPGMTWKISYGDGSNASGIVYSDVLTFNKLTVPNQAIEAADRLSPTFLSENGSDGLLGLAFPILNTIKPHPQKTPVQHLIEQKIISQPIFCAKLVKGGSGSYYTFGYIPQNVVDRNRRITYVDVDSSHGFWEFPCPQLRVGQHTVNQRPGNTAIADTGTTLILLEDSVLDDIYGQIRGARTDRSGWVLPSNAHCPDVSFSIGGNFFSISGEDLKFADSGNGMSFGAIQSRGSNRQDILGDVSVIVKYLVWILPKVHVNPRYS